MLQWSLTRFDPIVTPFDRYFYFSRDHNLPMSIFTGHFEIFSWVKPQDKIKISFSSEWNNSSHFPPNQAYPFPIQIPTRYSHAWLNVHRATKRSLYEWGVTKTCVVKKMRSQWWLSPFVPSEKLLLFGFAHQDPWRGGNCGWQQSERARWVPWFWWLHPLSSSRVWGRTDNKGLAVSEQYLKVWARFQSACHTKHYSGV